MIISGGGSGHIISLNLNLTQQLIMIIKTGSRLPLA